jgi:pimeloyl-ACP methyl ester carboxylesterase
VLLNAAGRFSSPDNAASPEVDGESAVAVRRTKLGTMLSNALASLQRRALRAVVHGSFHVSKQPARIRQVLRQVYPVDGSRVDAELIESIRYPAFSSPHTAEIFYRVVTRTSNDGYGAPESSVSGSAPAPTPTIDQLLLLLTAANTPLWLVWGEADPWIKSEIGDRIQRLKPDAVRVSVDAGHCPHDEAPHEVNSALLGVGAVVDALHRGTAASGAVEGSGIIDEPVAKTTKQPTASTNRNEL